MNSKVQLTEYIHREMDILFVALNAPIASNTNGHWFSRNLNFWNLLCQAGLITETIINPLEGDEKIFGSPQVNYKNWNYGVTDLVRDIVETNSASIKTNNKHVERVLSIVDKYPTKKICLMHSKVAEQFEKAAIIKRNYFCGKNNYGLVGRYKKTEIYEVPFHNAMITGEIKLNAYKHLLGKRHNQIKLKVPLEKTTESQSAKLKSSAKRETVFYLPDPGNSITQNDINSGTLRITANAAINFRGINEKLKIEIGSETFLATYTQRQGRSDLLRIGKTAMELLGLKAGGILRVKKLNGRYEIEKI